MVCRCVELSMKTLRDDYFTNRQIANLHKCEEKIKFLNSVAKCSGTKRKCLEHKADENMVQGGRGIGVLLSVLLPILADLIIRKS